MKITCLEMENFKNQQKLSVVFGENYTNNDGISKGSTGNFTFIDGHVEELTLDELMSHKDESGRSGHDGTASDCLRAGIWIDKVTAYQ